MSQAALKTKEVDSQVVTVIVQSQQALVHGQQATRELLGGLVQQHLDGQHVSTKSREGQVRSKYPEKIRDKTSGDVRRWQEIEHFSGNCPKPRKTKRTGNKGLRKQ